MTNEQLLAKFLDKSLSVEERALFDQRCKEDSNFALQVRDALYTLALIKTKENISEPIVTPFYRKKWVGIAVASLFAIIGIGLALQYSSSHSSAALAAEYYALPSTNEMKAEMKEYPQQMSSQTDSSKIALACGKVYQGNLFKARKILNDYENQQFMAVISEEKPIEKIPKLPSGESCEPYLSLVPQDIILFEYLPFYRGIAYYEQKEYAKAIHSFSLFEQSSNPSHKINALWYSTLAHLQLNENKKAQETLQQLLQFPKETNPDIYAKAQKLSQKLK